MYWYNVINKHECIVDYRGARGAVWFGFEAKSHPNRKTNKYAVWFGSVDF